MWKYIFFDFFPLPFFGFQTFIFQLLLGGGQKYMTSPAIVDFVKNAKFYEIVIIVL